MSIKFLEAQGYVCRPSIAFDDKWQKIDRFLDSTLKGGSKVSIHKLNQKAKNEALEQMLQQIINLLRWNFVDNKEVLH